MKQIHGEMKMADLIEVNYHLLAVLTRFGIEGGFGEKSVRDICEKNHLDTDTFRNTNLPKIFCATGTSTTFSAICIRATTTT